MYVQEAVNDGTVGSVVACTVSILEEWDMSVVKTYLVQKGVYEQDEIDEVEREYKRFLALVLAYRGAGRIPMCQKVDDMWHGHILFTEDYHAMCERLGHGYIHHRPCILDGGAEALKGDYEANTRPRYELHFGKIPKHIWEANMQICVNCCGSQS